MAAEREGRWLKRARALNWSLLIALIGFGVLRLLVLGNALEGISLCVINVPGVLILLNLWAATMRTWHLGGSVCWCAYCAYRVYLLAHNHSVRVDSWVIYIGSGGGALLALILGVAIHLGIENTLAKLRQRAAGSRLLSQANNNDMLPAVPEEAGVPAGEPLIWQPTTQPPVWPPVASGVAAQADEEAGEAGGVEAGGGASVWPPPGYTGS